MKLHEYLWEYIDDYQNKNPGLSDLEAEDCPECTIPEADG